MPVPRTGVLSPHAYFCPPPEHFCLSPTLSHPQPLLLPFLCNHPLFSARYSVKRWLYEGAELHYSTVMQTDHTDTILKAMPTHLLYQFNFRLQPNTIIYFFYRIVEKKYMIEFSVYWYFTCGIMLSFEGNVLMTWFQVKVGY